MIYFVCATCKAGLRVNPGQSGECDSLFGVGGEILPGLRCFQCEGRVELFVTMDADVLSTLTIYDVNPIEAFAAMNGLGLPKEQDCSATAVQLLFTQKKVARVAAHAIRNSHRCLLEYIEFEDGVRLYLGSSAFGATVYRISIAQSYAEKTP